MTKPDVESAGVVFIAERLNRDFIKFVTETLQLLRSNVAIPAVFIVHDKSDDCAEYLAKLEWFLENRHFTFYKVIEIKRLDDFTECFDAALKVLAKNASIGNEYAQKLPYRLYKQMNERTRGEVG